MSKRKAPKRTKKTRAAPRLKRNEPNVRISAWHVRQLNKSVAVSGLSLAQEIERRLDRSIRNEDIMAMLREILWFLQETK